MVSTKGRRTMTLSEELANKLYKEFPSIFPNETPGFWINDGWFDLVYQLCRNIQLHVRSTKKNFQWALDKYNLLDEDEKVKTAKPELKDPSIIVVQVKEKFGGLRFYYDGGDEHVDALVRMAETFSRYICEVCGNKGKVQSINGWFTAVCDKHNSHWRPEPNKKKGAVCFDFDGVINSYKSGFVAVDNIPDLPVPGAFKFIEELLESEHKVYVFSTRSKWEKGLEAIKTWMLSNGLSEETLSKIEFPTHKPIAKVYLDDRALEFRGTFPSVEEIDRFVPWHGGMSSSQK